MLGILTGTVPAGTPQPLGLGQSIISGVLCAAILVAALGVAFSRKAVRAAIFMVTIMVSLAGIYFAQGAEFLGATQIVVYTGAIMMLFLFVIMLVGVQAVDSPRDTKFAAVVSAVLLALALVVICVGAVWRTTVSASLVQPSVSEANGSPAQLANLLIHDHFFAMELVATLLIIAALGAMTLTHSDRLLPMITQRFVHDQRVAAYQRDAVHPGTPAPPGVYATSNALDVPALDAHGHPVEATVPRVMRVRGEVRSVGEAAPWVVHRLAAARQGQPGLYGSAANLSVERSGSFGMPGGKHDAVEVLSELEAQAVAKAEAAEQIGSGQADQEPRTEQSDSSVEGGN